MDLRTEMLLIVLLHPIDQCIQYHFLALEMLIHGGTLDSGFLRNQIHPYAVIAPLRKEGQGGSQYVLPGRHLYLPSSVR